MVEKVIFVAVKNIQRLRIKDKRQLIIMMFIPSHRLTIIRSRPKLCFKISMARRGNPYDNATCESFIKTLKTEEVYLWEYKTIEDAGRRICHFIKDVYNEKRLHSSLDYCPPNEFEELFVDKQKSTVPSQITLT